MNAELFIADAAVMTLHHDLMAYSDECNKRYDEFGSKLQFDWQCRRWLQWLGVFTGPFCGWMV